MRVCHAEPSGKQMRRLKQRWWLVLVCAAIATLGANFGCADRGLGPSVTDRADGSVPIDASPSVIDSGALPPGREDDAVSCADFRDDDGNGQVDCADTSSCGALPICCVGSTAARCCAPPSTLVPVLTLVGCASGVLSTCVTGMSTFGAPLPELTSTRADGGSCAAGQSLVPQGSDRSDGGLIAAASLDTSASAIALEATVGVSLTADATLDAIAVGLTAQTDLVGSSIARVRPTMAVLLSATDQTIRAVAGDIAFPAHALGSTLALSCSEIDVRIVTSPAGTFDAFYRTAPTSPWITIGTARPFEPSPAAHVVAYGRSTNPGVDGAHAWVRSVSVASARCDVMDPVRSTTGAFATLPSTHAIHSVSRVGSLAVYEMDGSIYVAGVDGTGHLQTLGRSGADGDRILAPGGMPFMMAGLADPELVAIDDNRRLLFTAISASGVRSIGYLDFNETVDQPVNGSMPRELVSPSAVAAISVDGPTYFETLSPPDNTLHRWVVFRAIVDATHSELRAAELIGPSAMLGINGESRDITASVPQFFTAASPSSPNDALYANRESDETAFDHDEIGAPEIVVYKDVIRVFFAARHGARWSIGMLRSPDFAHFELAYPDPVLAGSGVGFDAVSVTDPDVTVDGAGRLTLYYTATDGTTTQPGLATQEVPAP